jgi:prepilin peptidase CpaA
MLPFFISAIVLTAAAARSDWKTGLIPNWLTFGGVASGALGHFAHGWWQDGLPSALQQGLLSLAAIVLCSLVPALMFVKGGMGGGDVKLFAAIGSLCHPMLGLEAQMYAFAVLVILVPAQLAYEGRLLGTLRGAFMLCINPLVPAARRRPLPDPAPTWVRLGPAICAGTLISITLHVYGPLQP